MLLSSDCKQTLENRGCLQFFCRFPSRHRLPMVALSFTWLCIDFLKSIAKENDIRKDQGLNPRGAY